MSARRLGRRCPVDLSPLPPVPVATREDVACAVLRSREAQKAWRQTPFSERVTALKRACRHMLEDRNEILRRVRDEIGKLEADALFTEALGPLETLQGWVKVVKPHVEPRSVKLNPLAFPQKQASYQMVPRGVVGVIAPWNFPVAGLYRSAFPALLMGNGLVVKPSEYSPASTAWFVKHLASELPVDLAAVVQGPGFVGQWLIESGVDAVNFTGSAATGRRVSARCAELDLPVSTEQGGNDVAVVLADCDLDRTAAGITQWSLQNTGQACGAIEVLAVEAAVADSLVERLQSAFQRLRCRPSQSDHLDISPLAHDRQLQVVQAHVDDALNQGAIRKTGGWRTGDGLFYPPTLLDHCTSKMRVVKEETFGPVLAVVRIENPYEAVELIQGGDFGLTASVWTQDLDRGRRLAEQLDVGVVTINNHALTGAMPQMPWSGVRSSGTGIANSPWSLTTFARPRALLVDGHPKPEPFWLPVTPELVQLGHRLADAQVGAMMKAVTIPWLIRKRVTHIRKFFRSE